MASGGSCRVLQDYLLIAAQGLGLLWGILFHGVCAVLYLPFAVLNSIIGPSVCANSQDASKCLFYEGEVWHERLKPKRNAFRYSVRVAFLNLDDPPSWFRSQASDHMSADAARKFAGTQGPVKLLTNPACAGYIQNPISVYYCYGTSGSLERCISEVTNTPWGERVTFVFQPEGEEVPKSLHVSPLMDMLNKWQLRAPAPGKKLSLKVAATHPQHGSYFVALLTAQLSTRPQLRNEQAGFACLLRYGFQPHRIALWIYWQALVLLYKGVSFYGVPDREVSRRGVETAARSMGAPPPNCSTRTCFVWRNAVKAPWSWE